MPCMAGACSSRRRAELHSPDVKRPVQRRAISELYNNVNSYTRGNGANTKCYWSRMSVAIILACSSVNTINDGASWTSILRPPRRMFPFEFAYSNANNNSQINIPSLSLAVMWCRGNHCKQRVRWKQAQIVIKYSLGAELRNDKKRKFLILDSVAERIQENCVI